MTHPNDRHDPDELLRPWEVAVQFGVGPATINRWAQAGKITPLRTPGGHRRYSRRQVEQLRVQLSISEAERRERRVKEAVRLYDEESWSISRLAERFGCSYRVMRGLLCERTTLRSRGGRSLPRDSVAAHEDDDTTPEPK